MWEYAIGYQKDKQWHANGDDVAHPVLVGFLREMGLRGWEMSAATTDSRPLGTMTFYFKRPLPPAYEPLPEGRSTADA